MKLYIQSHESYDLNRNRRASHYNSGFQPEDAWQYLGLKVKTCACATGMGRVQVENAAKYPIMCSKGLPSSSSKHQQDQG